MLLYAKAEGAPPGEHTLRCQVYDPSNRVDEIRVVRATGVTGLTLTAQFPEAFKRFKNPKRGNYRVSWVSTIGPVQEDHFEW
jgi:hypothetical protein